MGTLGPEEQPCVFYLPHISGWIVDRLTPGKANPPNKISAPSRQMTRKGQPTKTEKLSNNDHSTPAKHHRKKWVCFFTPCHQKLNGEAIFPHSPDHNNFPKCPEQSDIREEVGESQNSHPHWRVMRSLFHKMTMKTTLGSWTSNSPGSNEVPFLPLSEEDKWSVRTFTTTQGQQGYSSPQCERRPHGAQWQSTPATPSQGGICGDPTRGSSSYPTEL